ncbi:type I methionyl aminopeptidase [Caloramator sp. CAR-1]|uniref:type I methionyl aminopeptidase n=1 Tax=Caloramator sp. CAR-1 TaxID=3062777 RepID=UPI0026E3CBF5|nr:type I methionyl aminopeptidase [Caloramator sp. CAR-1]MDO6353772.1 type I methionyl aminopeptidase [Caloramator sp. CAR-1]
MIYLKSKSEVDKIRRSGRIVAELLNLLEKQIRPGITTKELDKFAEEFIISHGAKPSFKGYYGYPGSLCTSINEEVVHGIPSDRILKEGDIISIDCGVFYEGFHSDAARTFAVGHISEEAKRLIDITEKSFYEGIKYARAGNRIGDISNAIQTFVESNGYSVVRDYVGHGIGKELHEEPPVPNYGKAGRGPKLAVGMVLAIEPMVNMGTFAVIELDDGWTVVTADKKLSAHYENTIAILENGPEILTII